jgi:hypothetical protein
VKLIAVQANNGDDFLPVLGAFSADRVLCGVDLSRTRLFACNVDYVGGKGLERRSCFDTGGV